MRKLRTYQTEAFEYYSKKLPLKCWWFAIPSIIQQSIVPHGNSFELSSVVNGFGSSVLAGYSAGTRFESICIVPMIAAGNAVSTFTAQNMGAKKPERVKEGYKAGIKMVLVSAIIIALIFRFFSEGLLTLFRTPIRNPGFNTGLSYLHFVSMFYVFIGAKSCTDGVLRGSGMGSLPLPIWLI